MTAIPSPLPSQPVSWRWTRAVVSLRGAAAGRILLLVVPVIVGLAACGRSAPHDATADTSGDPDIAGVSITSPDTVVSAVPTSDTTGSAETPPPADQPPAVYTVQPGDTLSAIASQYGVPVEALADFNGISDVNDLSPGQELAIPPQAPVEVAVVDATTGASETTTQP